jgi:hypothetical protein
MPAFSIAAASILTRIITQGRIGSRYFPVRFPKSRQNVVLRAVAARIKRGADDRSFRGFSSYGSQFGESSASPAAKGP